MDHHVARGIRFHAGCGVTSIARDAHGDVCGVELTNRKVLAADLIVYGIGVVPNIELAQATGLACDNGIRVDGDLLTTDPNISAIGDAANFPGPIGRLRLESVQNAVDQARHVSARIVGGRRTPYVAVPWFWSDQGALRLQIAGLSAGFDESQIVGDPQAAKFSVLCFARGRLVCVESVNSPGDHMAARKLLALPRRPGPEESLAAGFSLKSWSPLDSRATAAVRTAPVSCRTDS
jgi:NADPH-dependent 2,4-dienoyl-CoA reductase/sulfur reductase-like enzyme